MTAGERGKCRSICFSAGTDAGHTANNSMTVIILWWRAIVLIQDIRAVVFYTTAFVFQ